MDIEIVDEGRDGRFVIRTYLTTVVVSTVGPMFIDGRAMDIGFNRSHETMVFERKNWQRVEAGVHGLSEIDFEGYTNESDARAGHVRMAKKWAACEAAAAEIGGGVQAADVEEALR
jgi:hypothetical protein